jgi:PAS domain S-box-containing protein
MTVASQLRLVIGALMVVTACIVAAAFYVPYKLNSSANESYVEDVIPLRALVQDLVLQVTKQKAAVQAYLATGDADSLRPYYTGLAAANADLTAIRRRAARHPSMERLLRRAVPQISDLQGVFIASIAPASAAGPDRPGIAEVDGAFDRFNATASQMLRQTERFVREAEDEQRSTYRQLLVLLTLLASIALGLGALLLMRTPRRVGELYAAEARSRREAEARADAARALEHVTDGVILTDPEGRLRLWNPAAAKLLELSEREVVGRSIAELLPAWEVVSGRPQSPRDDGPVVLPVELPAGERWLSVTSAAFPEGRVFALRDVTEERALEHMRSEFLATASHELRTPMTAVYGAARTLLQRGEELPQARRRSFVEMIVAESERLSRIVDDILLASRLEAGRVDVAVERCRAQELAESVVESMRASAPPNVSLRLDAPADLPSIAVDPHRLRQVLGNILDNAVKYSPEGGEIVLTLAANGDRMRFEVRDEGLGFPSDQHERIFERFHRLDPHQTSGIGGTGLGLYISRELVERMRGRIWAESQPGRGAAFFVEVPLAG